MYAADAVLAWLMNAVVTAVEFLGTRDWSTYPLTPPVFSLCIARFVMPSYSRQFGLRLRSYLGGIKLGTDNAAAGFTAPSLGDAYDLINGITLDRALRISYLTGAPSIAVTIFLAAAKQAKLALCVFVFLVVIFLGPLLFVNIFIPDPGRNATTRIRGWRRLEGWTYHDLYSFFLLVLSLLSLGLDVLLLPAGSAVPH